MKRKVYAIILIVLAITSYHGYSLHKSDIETDLLLANVEALASSFEFDGKDWNTDHHWYNDTWGTNKWTPTLVDCTITSGIDIGIIVALETVNGKKVVCSSGSGNCVDGSSCSAG